MTKPTCEYCSYFRESTDRINKSTGYRKVVLRRCPHTNAYISSDCQICKEFVLHPTFWCDKNTQWLGTVVCEFKSEHAFYGCTTCKQGKLIKRMIKKYG